MWPRRYGRRVDNYFKDGFINFMVKFFLGGSMGLFEDKVFVEVVFFVVGRLLSLKEFLKVFGIKLLEYLEKLIEFIVVEYVERKSVIEVVRVFEDKYVM